MPAEGIELLVMTAGALAFAVVFVQPAVRTRTMVSGAGGLVGAAAIVAAPTLDLVVFVLLALGVLHASVTGGRSFAVRLRPPLLAAALIAIALVLIRVQGPDVLDRFAAVGIGAALAAAVGLLPYIHLFDPDEDVAASPFAWLAFIGPVLAAVLVARAQGLLSADAWTALAGILIGLGVLNMVWGTVAAWFCGEVAEAWRYSFIADWGLVLCGFGLTILDGSRGAFLALFGIVLCRLPLYLVYRSAPVDRGTAERPINLVVAAALAGSAPFAGFAARILLLRGATQVYWPLALVLAIAMLLWLPSSLRLGRSVGLPRGRRAVGVALVLALNVAAGLYPLPILSAAHL